MAFDSNKTGPSEDRRNTPGTRGDATPRSAWNNSKLTWMPARAEKCPMSSLKRVNGHGHTTQATTPLWRVGHLLCQHLPSEPPHTLAVCYKMHNKSLSTSTHASPNVQMVTQNMHMVACDWVASLSNEKRNRLVQTMAALALEKLLPFILVPQQRQMLS